MFLMKKKPNLMVALESYMRINQILQEERGGGQEGKELQKIPIMHLRIIISIYCYVQWQLLLYWKENTKAVIIVVSP